MDYIIIYIILFSIIVLIGHVFRKSVMPISLILVITGMLLSLVPYVPEVVLNPSVILNIFLPLLIYQISAFSSWRDVKKNFRPIALLSIGHVIFITVLVAITIHLLIPELGWALAFVLGAVISPPDDVAIVSISEKIRMPERVLTILKGEGMFNDATALILFRFALAAVITHQFSIVHAVNAFFAVIIGEILYGLAIGYIIGKIRTKIRNPMLHTIASLLTPFFAYIPAVQLGGCGVLATAVTGFIIGNYFALSYTAEFRLISRAVWPALAFTMENILFLLVGMNMRDIIGGISAIPLKLLSLYSLSMIVVVIIGRFVFIYLVAIIPRVLLPRIRKKDPYPSWRYLFLLSWSGMRGGISLAAALAVPMLPFTLEGNVNPRDLLIFLVFCVIIATLIVQGLSLPWVMKALGIRKVGQREKYNEHLAELSARIAMTKVALNWLTQFKSACKDENKPVEEINLRILEYRLQLEKLEKSFADHENKPSGHSARNESREEVFLLTQINEVERNELLKLWHDEKISLSLRNKLMDRLDHQQQHLPD